MECVSTGSTIVILLLCERDIFAPDSAYYEFQPSIAQIMDSLPPPWLAATNLRSQVQGLVRYIVHLTEALDQATIGFPDFERRKTK